MASSTARSWQWLKRRFTVLPVFVRRTHRIVGTLWLLSLAVTLAVPDAGAALPGPSIPGLTFIALILTGSYLLLRPWVRSDGPVADRWHSLTDWNAALPVLVRRTHRVLATLLLVMIGITLALQASGGSDPELLIRFVVGLLVVLVVSGLYMFFRPWVTRFRAG